jgi:hypothetical protein
VPRQAQIEQDRTRPRPRRLDDRQGACERAVVVDGQDGRHPTTVATLASGTSGSVNTVVPPPPPAAPVSGHHLSRR